MFKLVFGTCLWWVQWRSGRGTYRQVICSASHEHVHATAAPQQARAVGLGAAHAAHRVERQRHQLLPEVSLEPAITITSAYILHTYYYPNTYIIV